MKELSLNLLDIAENSVKAGATLTELSLIQEQNRLTMMVKDNGCGMSPETVRSVVNPFYTTRTTRAVGLGLPLLKLGAEQTGGFVKLQSRQRTVPTDDGGTTVTAVFYTDHIDCPPLGDIPQTVVTLIQGHPDTDFVFTHQREDKQPVKLDTRELRQILENVPLNSFEVLEWVNGYLQEQYL
jgi:nitrogen fixation/metabolism regulation signal transduction histidine kinase